MLSELRAEAWQVCLPWGWYQQLPAGAEGVWMALWPGWELLGIVFRTRWSFSPPQGRSICYGRFEWKNNRRQCARAAEAWFGAFLLQLSDISDWPNADDPTRLRCRCCCSIWSASGSRYFCGGFNYWGWVQDIHFRRWFPMCQKGAATTIGRSSVYSDSTDGSLFISVQVFRLETGAILSGRPCCYCALRCWDIRLLISRTALLQTWNKSKCEVIHAMSPHKKWWGLRS